MNRLLHVLNGGLCSQALQRESNFRELSVDKRKNALMVLPDNSDDCLKIHEISSSDSLKMFNHGKSHETTSKAFSPDTLTVSLCLLKIATSQCHTLPGHWNLSSVSSVGFRLLLCISSEITYEISKIKFYQIKKPPDFKILRVSGSCQKHRDKCFLFTGSWTFSLATLSVVSLQINRFPFCARKSLTST